MNSSAGYRCYATIMFAPVHLDQLDLVATHLFHSVAVYKAAYYLAFNLVENRFAT